MSTAGNSPARSMIPATANPIEALKSAIREWLFIPEEDSEAIDFIFAVFVSHRMPGDPLWGMLIDASGGGKTELLRALRDKTGAYFISKLTEKSLKSGYRNPKKPNDDPSLLPKLDGKAVVVKDLSPLLSMRRESRNAVLGDFRDAYDGFSDDGFGNVGRVSYQARFTVLAAATLAIERYSSVDAELGERFVKFRAQGKDNRAKVRRAVESVGKDDGWRSRIDSAVTKFLDALPSKPPSEIPPALCEAVSALADFTATARSAVPRDRNHELCYLPRPEVGTRLGKELAKLLLALAWVRGKRVPDALDLATVARVAGDCLHPNRLAVLSGQTGTLPPTTAKHAVSDLQILGILDANGALKMAWNESLAPVRNLLSTPTLLKPATSGVSRVFIELGEPALSTPPDIAGFQELAL